MTRREFHFADGTSNKFWAISVDGSEVTVQFGKVGTAGQTKVKPFSSPAEAQADADKLIAEKTRKGYTEVTAGAAPSPVSAAPPAPAVPPEAAPPSAPAPPSKPARKASAPPETVAPAAALPGPTLPAPERRLSLDPADAVYVNGPERPNPAPLPPQRPFDLEALKRLADRGTYEIPFDPDVPVTGPEARFWLSIYTETLTMDDRKKQFIWGLTLQRFENDLTLDEVKKAIARMRFWVYSLPILKLQRWWMTPADFVEALCATPVFSFDTPGLLRAAQWLETEFYPRLDEAAWATVRQRLRSLWTNPERQIALSALLLARNAGLDAELLAAVEGLKKADVPSKLVSAGWAATLLGVRDGQVLARVFRRLGLRLIHAVDARGWLVRTGHTALDVLRDSVLGQRKDADMLPLLDVLLLAESPEVAMALLEIKLVSKSTEAVKRISAWFRAHPEHVGAGLTPLAGENTPRGEAARALLPGSAAAPAGGPDPAPTAGVALAGDSDWLKKGLESIKPLRVTPAYADPAQLPPLPGLAPADVSRVVAALAGSTLAGPHPLVAALRRHGDRPALAAFAWKLFEGWLAAGAPAKEKWALLALGFFGDDTVVLKLTPQIRNWPGESQHQRAVTGLEVLRTIGSDTALTALNGMALKLKFKALQERARALMDAIAADRGLTGDQLEDRIVPDLGLDPDGSCTFDFGPRHFRFVWTADLSPAVVDEQGKQLKDLPKPGAKDDATKANAAVAAWKALKPQLRKVLEVQALRLEAAMITGRSWTAEEFRTLLMPHPFLSHLVRRLVWEGENLFRVGPDGATVGPDGAPVAWESAPVRLAHPLRLTSRQLKAWREWLEGTHLEQPFPQLTRPNYTPEPVDADRTELAPATGDIPAMRLRGILEERGWVRLMHDQGGITGFSKAYPVANVTAVIVLTSTILISRPSDESLHIRSAFFVPGANHPHGPGSDEFHEGLSRVRLAEVDPVAYSETVRDVISLLPGTAR